MIFKFYNKIQLGKSKNKNSKIEMFTNKINKKLKLFFPETYILTFSI